MAHLVVNVAWSSTNWTGPATAEDLEGAGFRYVQEHGEMHEELNFAMDQLVSEGRKHAHAAINGQPNWFQPGGLVFFHSKAPNGGGFRIVGCFGGAELNYDGWDIGGHLVSNIRAPLELCVPFPPEAHVVRDTSRHLDGAQRVAQGNMNYISGPTARLILLDARKAFESAGLDPTPLDRLLARLSPDDERHPAWVLGPWSGVTESWLRDRFDDVVRLGGSTAWWSWGLATSHPALRGGLMRDGYRVGITKNKRVVGFYDVAPGDTVDQGSIGTPGEQVPCPWPQLAGDHGDLPDQPDEANTRRLWFRITRAGIVSPPLKVKDFRSATGKGEVRMTQRGFRYAYPPKEDRTVPFSYDPTFEAACARLFGTLRQHWGPDTLRAKLVGPGTEAGHRIAAYEQFTTALRARPIDLETLRSLPTKLWPAGARSERIGIPGFLDHREAEAAILDLIEEREDVEAWAAAIDHFIERLPSLGYLDGDKAPGPASRALTASILLSAAWPDLFVDLRRSHYEALVDFLGLDEDLPNSWGALLVWAGGFARHLVRCPSWFDALGTRALSAVAGVARQQLHKEVPVDAAAAEVQSRIASLRTILDQKGQLILYGPPGTGKTWLARQLPELEGTTQLMTFHPSTAYEEFVEGIRPVLDGGGGEVRYHCRDGAFLQLCKRADEDPERPYTLIIDEINRGNIAAVLGELITLLERDKRAWITEGQRSERFEMGQHPVTVTLPYSGQRFSVPPNVRVVGTMNTADRSISLLDVALRRRFRFVEVRPDPRLIDRPDVVDGTFPADDGVQTQLSRVAAVLQALNTAITARRGRDFCLGHSYLLPLRKAPNQRDLLDSFRDVWQGELQPLLAEYFYEDWQTLSELLGDGLLETVPGPDGEEVYLGFAVLEGDSILRRLEEALGLKPAEPGAS